MTDETKVSEDQVRQEHIGAVNQPAHWIYLFAVLGGGFVLMVILIAIIAG